MIYVKFWKFCKILVISYSVIVAGQQHETDPTLADTACFTPDYTQGSCVPMAKCRRIEWMLKNWSPPYPQHIARYVRQSHCGSQGEVHYACCGLYDIKDHGHVQRPAQIPRPSPSPTFIHNPHYSHYSAQSPIISIPYVSNPSYFQHRPTVNYLRQPLGEQILRSMPCGSLNGDRIANGEIVRLSEFPWMVLLESGGGKKSRQRFRCAGTLITNQYVLTAAHCVEPKNDVISVRLGEHDLRTEHDCENNRKSHLATNCAPPYEDVEIENIIMHPGYRAQPMQNDIALIRLSRAVQFKTHIKPICLPLDAQINAQLPLEQIVAGWGVTEKGYASDILVKATLPIQSTTVCQQIFQQHQMTADEYICAGGNERRSTCRADSGGPLFAAVPYEHHQMRYVQFGITSAGSTACGSKHNLPGIYTNVRAYITWITGTIY